MKGFLKVRRAQVLALAAGLSVAVFAFAADISVVGQGHTGHTTQPQQPASHTGHVQSGSMPYDLHYIDMMAMHHEMGIEMARLAEEKSQDARVKAFAGKTIAEQEKDLKQLQFHRDSHYSGSPRMDHTQMMAHMQSMPGHGSMKMDMEGDMAKLRNATGRTLDRLFVDIMIHHHQMAVDMSKDAATRAEHSTVKEFARQTALKQQAEIAELTKIKSGLGGNTVRKTVARRKPVPKKKPAAKQPAHTGHTGHH